MKKDLRIIFMGTPDFAVASLEALLNEGFNIVGVITAVDKPAGRGKKIQQSPVKLFAIKHKLKILQPTNLKDENFIKELKSLNANLQIVVAFRMLPEIVWNMPSYGTFNLHASLLPNYRGAAPINWAIINGEKETGVTTFFINNKIDTGKIIFSEKIPITPETNAGELHDNLMKIGAKLVVKTANVIKEDKFTLIDQPDIGNNTDFKLAPKIYKNDCKINWDKNAEEIYNFIRGLSPYPAAFTELVAPNNKSYYIKIFKAEKEIQKHNYKTKQVITDEKSFLKIAVSDGFISLKEIQLSGKKKVNITDFLRGFPINSDWSL